MGHRCNGLSGSVVQPIAMERKSGLSPFRPPPRLEPNLFRVAQLNVGFGVVGREVVLAALSKQKRDVSQHPLQRGPPLFIWPTPLLCPIAIQKSWTNTTFPRFGPSPTPGHPSKPSSDDSVEVFRLSDRLPTEVPLAHRTHARGGTP